MHGAAYVPFRGGGEDRRGEFILIEVRSDNCSYKDRYVIGSCRYFACSCVEVLCFIFLQKKVRCKVLKICSCQRPPQAVKGDLSCVPPFNSVDNKARGKCDSVQPAFC